jgi:hypothetical protein
MGVVIGWQSSNAVTAATTTVPVSNHTLLGPRSGDSSGQGPATQVGAPIYILVIGTQVSPPGGSPGFIIPAGWSQLHVYYSPLATGPAFQLLTRTYVAGLADPTVGGGSNLSLVHAVSISPYIFGTGTLEVGTDSWGTPAVAGAAGLTQIASVAAPHVPLTTAILIGRINDQADFRDSNGASPHFYGDPYMNASSNRGIVAGWNYAALAATPGFYIGPDGGASTEFCAYAVAFSDSAQPIGLTANQMRDATRVKPEYRPTLFEDGGGVHLY